MAASLKRRRWLAGLLLTAQLLGGCRSDQDTLLVLTAASCIDAMEDVVQAFESSTQTHVRLSAASSNALAQQILAGVTADIFVSADTAWVDVLEKERLVKERKHWLSNELVMVVPRGASPHPTSPSDLLDTNIRHVAMAGEGVPAGKYAKAALQKEGIFTRLDRGGRIVRGEDVRLTLAFVERAEAQVGLVYATDARASSAVQVVHRFPQPADPPIRYPLARLNDSSAANEFFAFAQTQRARALIERHGFVTLDDPS